jgi:hypothetical protein
VPGRKVIPEPPSFPWPGTVRIELERLKKNVARLETNLEILTRRLEKKGLLDKKTSLRLKKKTY